MAKNGLSLKKCIGQCVEDMYSLYNGDSCEVITALPADSIHYSVSSIPFSTLFHYSNSYRCMGNNKNDKQFFEHMTFLVGEWMRCTMTGRLCSLHVMNLPTSKERDGYIGLRDFRGDVIRLMESVGWIYCSEVVVWKCPVVAVTRTKALGLLWKQLRKDSSKSRMGIPDYVLTFRKPGENPVPVSHTMDEYPVGLWQKVAEPIWNLPYDPESFGMKERELFFDWYFQQCITGWMDIKATRTLQSLKEEGDRAHICPLQLDVIERCINLWSNPGEIIFDPFAGIGSTQYQAVVMGRKGLGCELKTAYFDQSVKNMRRAMDEFNTKDIFARDSK